jgi:hypothetical protein
MDEIINWTVSKSKEIARGRNRKDNPNGWSPLTRVMRLRAKLVGAVHKRLKKGLDIGVCYKLFKEVFFFFLKTTKLFNLTSRQ